MPPTETMNWPKVVASAGQRHGADDDADGGAGDADRQRRLGALGEAVAAEEQRLAAAGADRFQTTSATTASDQHIDAEAEEGGGDQPEADPEDRAARRVDDQPATMPRRGSA